MSLQRRSTKSILRNIADLLGHGLNLRRDVNGEALTSGKNYIYDVSEQGLREGNSGEITSDHIKLLRLANAKPLHILKQVGGIEPILPVCLLTARQHAAI